MRTRFLGAVVLLAACQAVQADQDLHCVRVDTPPVVDGDPGDAAWAGARELRVRDAVADLEHSLRCAYTAEAIFLLASYPDPTENRAHKNLVWDAAEGRYRTGPRREDTLVLKWSMEPVPVDLRLDSDHPYRADVWYWKSARTDHAGFADDKYQIYTNEPLPRSRKLISTSGSRFYLVRRGDEGTPAYKVRLVASFEGEEVSTFELGPPDGSRSDIRARGVWSDGRWHVELARRLRTDNPDDVQFDPARSYPFGVSRYEIAGRGLDPEIEIPAFGAGEVGERLRLVFEVRVAERR